MKKFLTLCTILTLAFAAAISLAALSLTGCIAMGEMNEIKIYICTKPELDSYFELAKAERNATVEEIPKRGLSF